MRIFKSTIRQGLRAPTSTIIGSPPPFPGRIGLHSVLFLKKYCDNLWNKKKWFLTTDVKTRKRKFKIENENTTYFNRSGPEQVLKFQVSGACAEPWLGPLKLEFLGKSAQHEENITKYCFHSFKDFVLKSWILGFSSPLIKPVTWLHVVSLYIIAEIVRFFSLEINIR